MTRRGLEVDTAAELDRPAGAGVVAESEAGDVAECASADGYVGIADEFRVVGNIERLHTNLELTLVVDLEVASDARVHVGNARPAELIAAGVAKVRRDAVGVASQG